MVRTADWAIIERVMNGRPDEFELLVKKYDYKIQQIVISLVRNVQDQQDMNQDIWMFAFQHLSSLREPDRFPQWLYVIARNRCRKYLRERKSRGMAITELQTETPVSLEDEHLKRAKNRRIQKAMGNLSKSLQRTITMYYFAGCSCNEVSTIMDVPVGTVKRRLSEARKKLRTIFKGWSQYPAETTLHLRSIIIAAPICTTL